jgi:hypothetical protein
VWELFAAIVASDDQIARANLREVWLGWADLAVHRGRSRVEAFQETVDRLQKAEADEYELLIAKTYLATRRAFAARGEGAAFTVTPEGWRVYHAENQKAKVMLERAWKLAPDRWEAPTQMLNIGRNLGFDRAEIGEWFDRAMQANPDNSHACLEMLDYLLPKWQGSTEEYLGFAWQCVKTENVDAQFPLLPVRKFLFEVKVVGAGDDPAARAYYADPKIWHIIQRGYELQLAAAPGNPGHLSEYARLACVAGRYDVAHAQFETLGDKYWVGVFGTEQNYRKLRAEAQAATRAK